MFDFGTATDSQIEAIKTIDGPVLISAGPGTGKTFTLVQRILYMIQEENIDSMKIFMATFTNKAAKELLTRISNEMMKRGFKDINVNEMYIGTFHSLCMRIIKDNIEYSDLNRSLVMLDSFDQQYFIYKHLREEFEPIPGMDEIFGNRGVWKKAEILCNLFNGLTEEMIGAKKLLSLNSGQYETIAIAMNKYRNLLKENNKIDFSSIQSHCLKLLIDNPKLLKKYQEEFEYMMIDEYQDTNVIQERIIFLLSKTNNICVVGDDDQALYRFRGATIRNILEFPSKFPNNICKEIKLVENFRSVPDIVNFYNDWMHKTTTDAFEPFDWKEFRIDKTMVPHRESFCGPNSVLKVSHKTRDKWHEKILEVIKDLKSYIQDYNQIAFLFNSVKSDEAVELADYLEKNGIGVYSPRSNVFFNRVEIRQMIGTILLLFPNYRDDLQLGKHEKWIGKDLQIYLFECIEDALKNVREDNDLKKWVTYYQYQHKELKNNTDYAFSNLFYELFQFDAFKKYMDTDLNLGIADQRGIRNTAIFSNLLAKFEYNEQVTIFTTKNIEWVQKQFFNNFIRFLYSGGIEEYQDESEYAPRGCVSFLTIHQSKGMEFPIVFVGSLKSTPRKNQNPSLEHIKSNFPEKASFEPEEDIKVFDFWRKYYVAFSRAQDVLILTCNENEGEPGPKSRGRVPSIYFKPYYNPLSEYDLGNYDFSAFDFHQIKDTDLKDTYAFTTDIASYERCATQYKMYRVLGFSAVRDASTIFGSVIHETIEDIHRAVLRDEMDLITNDQVDEWFEENYNGLIEREHSYLQPHTKKIAREQVAKYVENNHENWSLIKETEVDLIIEKEGYFLKGQIDLLKTTDNGVEILDFKAEQKPSPEKLGKELYEQKIAQYRKQLQIYAHLVEQKFRIEVSGMKLYYTNTKEKNPYIIFEKNDFAIDEMIDEFSSIVDQIQKKNFASRTKNTSICADCDMRYYCNRIKR